MIKLSSRLHAAAALLLLVPPILACDKHSNNDDHHHSLLANERQGPERCGTKDLTPEQRSHERAAVAAYRARIPSAAAARSVESPCPVTVTINVFFNVITNGGAEGDLSAGDVAAQIDVLNQAYAPSGFAFNLVETRYYDNPEWFDNCGTDESFKKTIRLEIDPRDTGNNKKDVLYMYTCKVVSVSGEILGLATYPFPDSGYLDGVLLHYTSLPGGSWERFNEGATGVHEVSGSMHSHVWCILLKI